MKDPKIILNILSKKKGKIDNLYRYLYIPEFYYAAYNNIHSKSGQMTPASDDSTIDGMPFDKITKLIEKLRDNTYNPTPLKRVNIPKKNGKLRPISIPSFEDKLVQEVIRTILEAIYEPTFSKFSHGFRPNRSCHTALADMQDRFIGTKWWIDCDIKGCFDNINHQRLIQILAERIKEQKFLNLINKFLKAGYIENWKYHKTFSGVPQGTIISPILANIYLDKFDKYMESLINDFKKGKKRETNKNTLALNIRCSCTAARIRKGIQVEKNKERLKRQVKEKNEYARIHGYYNNQDPNFRRLQYIRYADDFVIGIIASKKEAKDIETKIKDFLKDELILELNADKTKLRHNSEKIIFLGYEIFVMKSDVKKVINGKIGLYMPYKVAINFIINNKIGKWVQDKTTGKKKLKGIPRLEMVNDEDLEILQAYNSQIRGLYNYYCMANNVSKLNGFGQISQDSFLRTLATKYKTKCAKLYKNKKYSKQIRNRTIVGITYKDEFKEYFDGPFKCIKTGLKGNPNIDLKIN